MLGGSSQAKLEGDGTKRRALAKANALESPLVLQGRVQAAYISP